MPDGTYYTSCRGNTIQAFGGVRGQPVATLAAVSYGYQSGRVVSAEVPTLGSVGGANALWIEAYGTNQGYAHADAGQADRSLRLKQQALEARHGFPQMKLRLERFDPAHRKNGDNVIYDEQMATCSDGQ